jgi:hypothetical protein
LVTSGTMLAVINWMCFFLTVPPTMVALTPGGDHFILAVINWMCLDCKRTRVKSADSRPRLAR